MIGYYFSPTARILALAFGDKDREEGRCDVEDQTSDSPWIRSLPPVAYSTFRRVPYRIFTSMVICLPPLLPISLLLHPGGSFLVAGGKDVYGIPAYRYPYQPTNQPTNNQNKQPKVEDEWVCMIQSRTVLYDKVPITTSRPWYYTCTIPCYAGVSSKRASDIPQWYRSLFTIL